MNPNLVERNTSPRPSPHFAPPTPQNAEREKRLPRFGKLATPDSSRFRGSMREFFRGNLLPRGGLADFRGLFTEGGSFRRAEMPGSSAGKMPAATVFILSITSVSIMRYESRRDVAATPKGFCALWS
jgi:hypothetical protein